MNKKRQFSLWLNFHTELISWRLMTTFLKTTTTTTTNSGQENKRLSQPEVLRWSVYIFWSSCNLFEAIERFTILFLKHVWSSNKKKFTNVISSYRSYSQVFLPKDHKDIHNVVSFQMLTNKYSTSALHPVFQWGQLHHEWVLSIRRRLLNSSG